MRLIIILMGVCGTGKSEVAKELSSRLRCEYIEADEHHSEENKQKMRNGMALTDTDRHGWLLSIRDAMIQACASDGQAVVVACSALKESYRATLSEGLQLQCRFVHLKGPKELIKARIQNRKHFMNPNLLDSQFETLEEPKASTLTIEVDKSIDEISNLIEERLVQKTSWFGVCGMGVMGTSLARNLASKGVPISLYNRINQETNEINIAKNLLQKYPIFTSFTTKCCAFDGDLQGFVSSLQRPRKILIMATAGKVVDLILQSLLPYLEEGDLVVDAGNSHFVDTERRQRELFKNAGIHLLGCGVSGGEEGALNGPAIMVGGMKDAFETAKPYLEAISSRDRDGRPCCGYMGEAGSGHFVKTVHNGLEYAEMQLLAEMYSYLKFAHKLDNEGIAACFQDWQNNEPLTRSYLMEITITILLKKENGISVLDTILDKSGNKGTGNWTAVTACELGQPTTMVTSSLFARYLSSMKEMRLNLEQSVGSDHVEQGKPILSTDTLRRAYLLAKMINHHQGLHLLYEAGSASAPEKYRGLQALNLAEICRVWTSGCILRSEMLHVIKPTLLEADQSRAGFLIGNPELSKLFKDNRKDLKSFVCSSIETDLAVPCFSDALQYLTGLTTGRNTSSALIQAQRDYFGSHGYQRLIGDTTVTHHTHWKEGSL